MPVYETFDPAKDDDLDATLARLAADCDVVVVDTPGRDDPYRPAPHARADTLVTPINDSFVDLDLIGEVDPDTYKIRRPASMPSWSGTAGPSAPRPPAQRRLGGAQEPPPAYRGEEHAARSGKAWTSLRGGSASGSFPGLGERVIYRELSPRA
jgi:chromosome partitioning protein